MDKNSSKLNGKLGGRPKQDSKIYIELPDQSLVIQCIFLSLV